MSRNLFSICAIVASGADGVPEAHVVACKDPARKLSEIMRAVRAEMAGNRYDGSEYAAAWTWLPGVVRRGAEASIRIVTLARDIGSQSQTQAPKARYEEALRRLGFRLPVCDELGRRDDAEALRRTLVYAGIELPTAPSAAPPAAGDASIGVGTGSADDAAIAGLYARLAPLAPLLLQKQAEGQATTIIMEGAAQCAGRGRIGDYTVNMVRAEGPDGRVDANSRVAAMFLQTGPDAFTVVGSGDAVITFTADTPGPAIVGLESIDELVLRDGRLARGRRLNGDENGQGQVLRLHSRDAAEGRVHEVKLYRYR